MDVRAFQLSRVYGQGWTAAKKLRVGGGSEDLKQAAALNPYRTAEERARWSKGFEEGLRSITGAHSANGSWRPPGRR